MRYRNVHGFTLIEVLVSVVVLAVGISGVMMFLAQATRRIEDARKATIQASLAREVMVNVENQYWRKQADKVDENGDFGSDFPGFRFEVAVTENIDEKVPSLCQVDVTVFRKTVGNAENAYTISTYLIDFKK